MKPFIAKDTKEPLVVFGAYRIGEGGGIISQYVPPTEPGKDYGCDPVGDGNYKMVPSGDIVDFEERCRRLGRK